MTTIVSAFISNVNERLDRNLEKYWQWGKLLLQSNTPKIIFLDSCMLSYLKENYIYDEILQENNRKNTIIYEFHKEDIYLYSYLTDLKNSIETDNPSKDTLEFMMTMCNKTEWIREAIQKNPFQTSHFIWVDFGIRHVFQCNVTEYIQKLNALQHKTYEDTLRIASIWNPKYIPDTELYIYKQICWYFAGGVFGGNKEKLLWFADKMKEKCLWMIQEKKTLIWEVNLWYLIYKEYPHMFSLYTCDHNDSIIVNY